MNHIKLILLLFISCFTLLLPVTASAKSDYYKNFKAIPILHEGRVKPLDTYARHVLIQFSGKDYLSKEPAIAWLAKLLFAPDKTVNDKVFLINNPDIATALSIDVQEGRRYSYRQLAGAYLKMQELEEAARNINEHDRSLVENEIIRVTANFRLYINLVNEFGWAYPQDDFTVEDPELKASLDLPQKERQFSFYDMAVRANRLKDMDLSDPALTMIVKNMVHRAAQNKDLPFTVIPLKKQGQWKSSWDAISLDFPNQDIRALIKAWHQMALDYPKAQWMSFDLAAHQYRAAVNNVLNDDERKHVKKFPVELTYHAATPFLWAKLFYILSFVFFVVSFLMNKPWVYRAALGGALLGFVLHGFGLAARIIIMGRPPVSNLYETFIFVGFITVLLGILIEWVNRRWLGIVTAAISGAAMLFIASKYSAEGDTLKMLVAVLNSNFWLATHVTTITMGYGATCVAGILGHIWLIQAVLKKDKTILDNTYRITLGMMGVALTLTFLGTNLGGIWADQSWGRFWGWDPKENGALMIVLWVAMLFHAKFAKIIGDIGLAVGCVIGMMVVMWAWFGVNLLSIGLHSYGFTSGIANALGIYAVCEIVFIALMLFFLRK